MKARRLPLAWFLASILLIAAGTARGQMLERRWARSLPDLASSAIAPDGSVVIASNRDGLVQSLAGDGHVSWRARFPEPVRCAVSAGGTLCVAWPAQSTSPTARTLIFLDKNGRTVHTERMPDAIRNVTVTDDGRRVAVLSGSSSLTIVGRTARGWQWQRRRLTRRIDTLASSASGDRLALGLEKPSGVCLVDDRLHTLWQYQGSADTTYDVRLDRRGSTLVALAQTGRGRVATLLVWNSRSPNPRWSRPLRGDLPHLDLTPDGRYVAAAYRSRLWFRGKSAVEWRVTLYSESGRSLWEVGGLIFGAHLIGVTGPPYLVLTHDNARVLAALDTGGHMRARHRLASAVQSTQASADGSHFTVVSDVGVLYLFRAHR